MKRSGSSWRGKSFPINMIGTANAWIDRAVFARAAKAGIYALQIDERYGGAGEADYRYRMVVV